ncbi:MAG: hypothetical protein LV471_09205 [Nitrosomonas sp.]|nr:hypothetical protein [Nitrosomonas sp.]
MRMLDDAGVVGGVEKLRLVRELGVIRKNLPEVAGVNKLTLVKRVREIRQLLSVSNIEPAVSLSIDPSNPVESLKSLTNYLQNGLSAVPEALRGAEADTALGIYNLLLPRDSGDEFEDFRSDFMKAFADVMRNGGTTTNEEWMALAFEHFKSSGAVFDVDKDVIQETLKSIDELTMRRIENDPEIVELLKDVDRERESTRLKLSNLAKINSANGYTEEDIERSAVEYEAALNQKSVAWEKIKVLTSEKRQEQKKRIAELKASLEPAGQKVIDTLLNSSRITVEQANSWASNQVIEKLALNKLKKSGYMETDIRRDMAEFYRVTGGKLRQIRIETDGSRRANATGIGHFEDNVIRPGSNFNKAVLWHEMAHHLEGDPAAKAASNGYLLKRRKSEKVYSLRSLTGNRGYQSKEVAYSDNFINHYIGKVYRDKTTEVWSMGIQYLSNPSDAAMFVAKDPEMAALVAGYLQSDLTPAMKALQAVQDSAKDKAQEKREQVKSEYAQALDKLSAGVEIVDDGWFGALDHDAQRSLLGWGGVADPNAKFIGSWGGYRVFAGKFKDKLSRRTKKGYAVAYATATKSFISDDNRKFIPNSAPVHGDERLLKAFMRMASMNDNQVYSVYYNMIGDEARVVEEANKLSGEQS